MKEEDLEPPDQLLLLSEAKRRYRLHPQHVYAAVKRGEVMRFQRGDGFALYPESQLRRLAKEIGLYSESSAA